MPKSKRSARTKPQKSEPKTWEHRKPRVSKHRDRPHRADRVWLYGFHPVIAALGNPDRTFHDLIVTDSAVNRLPPKLVHNPRIVSLQELDSTVGRDSVHQGVALQVSLLPERDLEPTVFACAEHNRPILFLDQVTDPHNVGAIFRSAAAFGVGALVTQDRHSPAETGILAKAASGMLENLPWVRVTNIARALDAVAGHGYFRIGLDGSAETRLDQLTQDTRTCIVLGAEGAGLRRNTIEHCDCLARLAMAPGCESLNVSNAAAVALYDRTYRNL
ncbi:MAG: RNA methyltransferase [Pseudomonadota bacterium]